MTDTDLTVTTLTVIMAAVTGLSTFGAGVLAYLASRDKMRFDKEVSGLRESVKECEETRKELKGRLETAEGKAEKAEALAARMEGELKGVERELVNLRGEVTELRDRLYGKSK